MTLTEEFLKKIIKDRKSGIAIEKRHFRGNAFPLSWPPLGRKCNLESFSLSFLFEKNRFPGDSQKHFRNSGRFGPLVRTSYSDD